VSGTNQYADPEWVRTQMNQNPEWAHELSPDGKTTNLARVRKETVPAVTAARAPDR
jgi:hypothetical protein